MSEFTLKLNNLLTNGATNASILEAVSTQLPGRTNGPADVYRHLVLSAELTRTGQSAEAILDLHEFMNGGDDIGTYLDNPINNIGLQIGNYVRANAGGYDDVLNIVNSYMEKSLSGKSISQIDALPRQGDVRML